MEPPMLHLGHKELSDPELRQDGGSVECAMGRVAAYTEPSPETCPSTPVGERACLMWPPRPRTPLLASDSTATKQNNDAQRRAEMSKVAQSY